MKGLRQLFRDNLANRTLFVLIIGLTGSHVLSTAVYIGDRDVSLTLFGPSRIAAQMASLHGFLDGLPPEFRASAVARLSAPSMTVLLADPPNGLPAGTQDDAALLARLARDLHAQLPAAIDQGVRLSFAHGAPYDPHPEMRNGVVDWISHLFSHGSTTLRQVQASIPLSSGERLTFAAPVARDESHWSAQFLASLLLMGATVVFAGWWLVRRFTRSLSTVAESARNIGLNRDVPPMAVKGPLEVRLVAEAFNTMRDRLARFVSDRTQMLAAISHDLRTPITRLRLRTDQIAEAPLRERMLRDLAEMEKMIASTLAFARNDAEHESSLLVDVAILLHTIADEFADLGHGVTYGGPDKLLYECRPLAMSRAVTNLVENAVTYGGGAEILLEEDEAEVRIHVRDRGPGIPTAQLEEVFQPYVRLDSSRTPRTASAGLGLSIARSVLHAHGGTITLANRPEGGLSASMFLPKA